MTENQIMEKEQANYLPRRILNAVVKLENEIHMLDEWFQVQCGEEIPNVKTSTEIQDRPPLVPLLQTLPDRLGAISDFAAGLRDRIESRLTVSHGPDALFTEPTGPGSGQAENNDTSPIKFHWSNE